MRAARAPARHVLPHELLARAAREQALTYSWNSVFDALLASYPEVVERAPRR